MCLHFVDEALATVSGPRPVELRPVENHVPFGFPGSLVVVSFPFVERLWSPDVDLTL